MSILQYLVCSVQCALSSEQCLGLSLQLSECSAMCNVQCTLCSLVNNVHCTVHRSGCVGSHLTLVRRLLSNDCTAYWTLETATFKLLTFHCILHTFHCALPTLNYTLLTAHSTLPTTHSALHTLNWKLCTKAVPCSQNLGELQNSGDFRK